ncbi:MAG TPA: 2-phospho-L-lactate guanylyltransferase [Anaerolineaceae bacterium]|nr:2-phospho-L-lactate guanylyltransferase [Anaerolineaceae bacterium]
MNSWVIIPVKPFKHGKSRLRACFEKQDLYALNYNLFVQTIETVKNAGCFDHILVISSDRHAQSIARQNGLDVCVEQHQSSLNLAVSQAMEYVIERGGGQGLVIPTDLPKLTPGDLAAANELIPNLGILIVPDHFYRGTNALGMSCPKLIEAAFGTNSFHNHCSQAQQKELTLRVYYNQAIMHDLDTQPDLELIRQDHHLLLPVPREERIP